MNLHYFCTLVLLGWNLGVTKPIVDFCPLRLGSNWKYSEYISYWIPLPGMEFGPSWFGKLTVSVTDSVMNNNQIEYKIKYCDTLYKNIYGVADTTIDSQYSFDFSVTQDANDSLYINQESGQERSNVFMHFMVTKHSYDDTLLWNGLIRNGSANYKQDVGLFSAMYGSTYTYGLTEYNGEIVSIKLRSPRVNNKVNVIKEKNSFNLLGRQVIPNTGHQILLLHNN